MTLLHKYYIAQNGSHCMKNTERCSDRLSKIHYVFSCFRSERVKRARLLKLGEFVATHAGVFAEGNKTNKGCFYLKHKLD